MNQEYEEVGDERRCQMKHVIRVSLLTVFLAAAVIGGNIYSKRPVKLAEQMALETVEDEIVESDVMLGIKADLSLAGFTEALFCGWTPGGNWFWEEFSGGLPMLHAEASKPHQEFIIMLVDGKTGYLVESKGFLGSGTVNQNLAEDQELSHLQTGGGVDTQWKGDTALMGKMRFTCASNPAGTFSKGAVYHACGTAGLHVVKDNKQCEWTHLEKKNQMFYLYYKQATKCIIQQTVPPPPVTSGTPQRVCVSAKPGSNTWGDIKIPKTGNLLAMKFKWISGLWKTCGPSAAPECIGRFGFTGWGFAVTVTRANNPRSNVLFPVPGKTLNVQIEAGNWNSYKIYRMAGKNPKTDSEMTLEKPVAAVTKDEILRVYESEILHGIGADGSGDVCFDVTLTYQ